MNYLRKSILDGITALAMLAASYKFAVDRDLLGAALFGFTALVFAFGSGQRAMLHARGE